VVTLVPATVAPLVTLLPLAPLATPVLPGPPDVLVALPLAEAGALFAESPPPQLMSDSTRSPKRKLDMFFIEPLNLPRAATPIRRTV
jgi:hypothetical protein